VSHSVAFVKFWHASASEHQWRYYHQNNWRSVYFGLCCRSL